MVAKQEARLVLVHMATSPTMPMRQAHLVHKVRIAKVPMAKATVVEHQATGLRKSDSLEREHQHPRWGLDTTP